MLSQTILVALGIYAGLATANTPIDNSVFTNDPLTAVKAAAPLWHFDVKTCFPTYATQVSLLLFRWRFLFLVRLSDSDMFTCGANPHLFLVESSTLMIQFLYVYF
jgi:hypothetical protein